MDLLDCWQDVVLAQGFEVGPEIGRALDDEHDVRDLRGAGFGRRVHEGHHECWERRVQFNTCTENDHSAALRKPACRFTSLLNVPEATRGGKWTPDTNHDSSVAVSLGVCVSWACPVQRSISGNYNPEQGTEETSDHAPPQVTS